MPQAAERFVAINGPHAGNEVEVVRSTGSSLVVKTHGGGKSWNKRKEPGNGLYHLPQEVFDTNYRPLASVAELPATKGGNSYRRKKGATPEVTQQPTDIRLVQPQTGLVVEVVTITPDLAKAWIERSGDILNRPLSERRVERLVTALQRGQWTMTGDSIKLDADSKIRDGQHRLHAIARSGVEAQSLVVRNVAEEAFDYMDTGAGRTPSDLLAMHGARHRFAVGAVTRSLLMIERSGRPEPKNQRGASDVVPSGKDQVDYLDQHQELIAQAVQQSERIRSAGLVGGVGLWATVLVMLLRVDESAATFFIDSLVSGTGLESGSPILRLRNLAMADRNFRGSKSAREILMAIAIKAWNSWRRGESVRALSWRSDGPHPEPFPVPV